MNQRCPREVPVCWAGYGGSNAAPSAPYHIGVKNNGDFRIGQDLGRTGKYSSNGIRNCPLIMNLARVSRGCRWPFLLINMETKNLARLMSGGPPEARRKE
jgi:hypothetical protein